MNGHRGRVSKLMARALLSLASTTVAAVLLAPAVAASPIGDAESAIMAAWEQAGGDTSTLGARKGDVYPVGDGFALDFDGGKMFFSEATGARYLYGPILDKYESLGGPADSDMGFPTINEVPGLAGPDSRVSTFSASDNPVIFWTPEHGAFVVRGALNVAWDELGSSGGDLGVPVGDETYDGEVASQKFSGGEVSWNRQTKEFTTVPAVLADRLKGLQMPIDPAAAINMAWRAAGGAAGPLGAREGDQYPIGGDGIAQDFAGGKIFFSPATGANAVEGEILAKYESLGGPVGSDLGFPIANESDGGIEPSSRVVTFSAADKPVIFWTPDQGAFVVRGAIKAAWDKLRGPAGKLGAPVADQVVDGDLVSQKFSGGKISWNRADNEFTTEPANLAPLLSGLQVPGQDQPSDSTAPPQPKKFTWHWWWLIAGVLAVLLIVLLVLVVIGVRRRRFGDDIDEYEDAYERADDVDAAYDSATDGRWPPDELDFGSEQFSFGDQRPPEHSERVSWPRSAAAFGGEADHPHSGEPYDSDELSESDRDFGIAEDPDAVDTTPTPVVSYADLSEEVVPEPAVPETVVPESFVAQTSVPDTRVSDVAFADAYFPTVSPPGADYGDTSLPEEPFYDPEERTGRHAAVERESYAGAAREDFWEDREHAREHPRQDARGVIPEWAPEPAQDVDAGAAYASPREPDPSPMARPTIHMPLEDPYQVPAGYPIKASARFGLYYTPEAALYHDTLAEIWFASEEAAQANGFVKAD